MVAHKGLVCILIGLSIIYRNNVVYCTETGKKAESESSDPSDTALTSPLPESDSNSTDANQAPANESQPSTNSETYTKIDLDLLVKSSTNHFYYTKNKQTGFEFYLCKQGFVFNSVKESVGSKCLDYFQSITGTTGTTLSIENDNSSSLVALMAPKSTDPNTLGASKTINLQGSSSDDDSEPCVSKAIWNATGGSTDQTTNDVFAYYVVVGSTTNVHKTITLYLTDGTIKRFHKARHYAQWVERPLSVKQQVKAVDLNSVYENVGKGLYMREDLRAIKSNGEPSKLSSELANESKETSSEHSEPAQQSEGSSGGDAKEQAGQSAGEDASTDPNEADHGSTPTDPNESEGSTKTGTEADGTSPDSNQASSTPANEGTGTSSDQDQSSTPPDQQTVNQQPNESSGTQNQDQNQSGLQVYIEGSETPNDTNKCVKKNRSNGEEYEIKDNGKCTLVKCDGKQVWKHGDHGWQENPKYVSYTNGYKITINFENNFITYEKSGDKWSDGLPSIGITNPKSSGQTGGGTTPDGSGGGTAGGQGGGTGTGGSGTTPDPNESSGGGTGTKTGSGTSPDGSGGGTTGTDPGSGSGTPAN